MENSKELTPWQRLTIARMLERPTSLDYIDLIFDSFMEFHGDRAFGDDAAIVGGVAEFDGMPVTVIGQQKGRNTNENIKRNFGMPSPEGYRKALRLMKQAEKFNRPLICFVDTSGAYCGVEAEERGQGEAIAKNLLSMANLKVPIITIVIGEGGSGGALAMAVADEVWMLENSVYSLLSPEGFASILWKDSSRAKEAAEVMKITAADLKGYGIIDKVINEPEGGAQNDINIVGSEIKENLKETIKKLLSNDINELLQNRYDKFRQIGKFIENEDN
ncbi:acetyl-CoA carboxylase carboxyltransferase subunit alpha [Clostridium felsineum]|uniref:Acetyl-coenzyme A carboxylase carboxyl transferase subunit alpha n=1 Tax=Clostridium felsineum TaxID=36839 RepID=A0A1S8L600_9CLOT|nr:acetyl-CoA carboxylase carboxyltransferase subunit alpha [Clostridium felsineum]MCR3757417.1 acetyl-CoA carboxylase carboxyltransferase subunit alpha [Clostridium felsineum]URZ02992.1 Acetyl-coenzyme A carboxylase carboxyl transferase subunit alpha [Clostridium felsineum]URZ08673.1 Acetyl-coenzyme A carboxylase carboxyl transferase subunit alpha [Clostridium felsineum]URZ13703.1 Acetyl-coenzyme A carboxylase carboxyl transferase subunit alpha [Clostridium felsineum]URZ14344.1 Acetyl-coenzym